MQGFKSGDILRCTHPSKAGKLFLVIGFIDGVMHCHEFDDEKIDLNALYWASDNLMVNIDVGKIFWPYFEKVTSLLEERMK